MLLTVPSRNNCSDLVICIITIKVGTQPLALQTMQKGKANLLSLRCILMKSMINVSEAAEVMIFLNLPATSLISFNVLRLN